MKRILFWWVCMFGLLSGAQAQNPLQTAIHVWVADQDLQQAKISMAIIDADTRQLVASWDPHALLTPASSLKVLTTSTALVTLGADYRFKTELQYDGTIDANGILRGNLYIKGYGDPVLGSDQMEGTDNLDGVMQAFQQAVKEAGIRQITGRVVGDASFYSGEPVPASWKEEDAGNYYGAGAWALNIHENFYYLPFKQSAKLNGEPRALDPYPPVPEITFLSEVRSGASGSGDNAYIYGGPYDYNCPVKGTIPLGSGIFKIKGAVPDPPLMAAQILSKTLGMGGVEVVQAPVSKKEAGGPGRKVIYTHYSPSLQKIVERANQESVNLYCEALLLAIGMKQYGEGSRGAGLQAIKAFWVDRGISLDGNALIDGSGLSVDNRVSSYQLAQIIRKIYADPQLWPLFGASLPVAGKSGTLSDMLKGTAAEGRIQAKSGSMKSVRSYTGIVHTKSGRSLAFCMIANDFSCSSYAMRKKMEQLLLRMVQE
ncbi:MAG: D-alanyl-D-alanine carboxypeptidase/D-alanyl-D-alanine-endopeptidase [Saprospirales bacterium]|nr:D-alanyl-D-alanine carboxypeptidase/D-alanyl-D-alanine-endopeptidase [Saprospirales bacterium]